MTATILRVTLGLVDDAGNVTRVEFIAGDEDSAVYKSQDGKHIKNPDRRTRAAAVSALRLLGFIADTTTVQ